MALRRYERVNTRALSLLARCCMSSSATPMPSVQSIEELSVQEVEWKRGERSRFHNVWLRDHCQCDECIHETTRQRQVCTASIPDDIAVVSATVEPATPSAALTRRRGSDHVLTIDWASASNAAAAHRGHIPMDWLRRHAYWHVDEVGREISDGGAAAAAAAERDADPIVLWDVDVDQSQATVDYDAVLSDENELRTTMNVLHTHGFALVRGTPEKISTAAAELIAQRLCGYVRQTLYGSFDAPHYGMWDTAPREGLDVNDTAYTNLALPPHTDGSYFRDPPGLQIFNVDWMAKEGGFTLLVDGFRVANELRAKDPAAFEFLVNTVRTCSKDL